MTDQPDSLVLELLRAIRAEQQEMRHEMTETNAKLGTLAQSMVSMRKDIGKLDEAVQGLRTDVRMIAIAVDEHTNRLDKIEAHYNPI